MRLVRLGEEPSKVGVDIRAAVAAWGPGNAVLGGVALFGCTPPGCPRPLDAVIVLPRAVVTVLGADLPQPALKLEAPLQTPWSVDGWPLVRAEGAVNPGLEAVESATALARMLQEREVEPLPVVTMVVVGPFAEQVTQPTNDLHRGIRVVPPTTTSLLAAARELATYERACSAESARRILEVLDPETGRYEERELVAEGFPEVESSDLGSADTLLISRVDDVSGMRSTIDGIRGALTNLPRRIMLITASVGVLLVLGIVVLLLFLGGSGSTEPPSARGPIVRVDGLEFTRMESAKDTDCVRNSFGDVQVWLTEHPCLGLSRSVFSTTVSDEPAAVSVAVVDTGDEATARELRAMLDQTGTGGIGDLATRDVPAFDNAAQAIEHNGTQVRVVRAVWSDQRSDGGDVQLRALTERGLRLP